LNFEIDMLRRVLAAIIYVAGLCAVLYVAYFVPYINPEEDESMSAINNWGLLVTGMALILVASVLWAVRFSSDASHNGEHGERLSNENE
jgi:hypothetical protein